MQLFLYDDYKPNNKLNINDINYKQKFKELYVDKKIYKKYNLVYPSTSPFYILYVILCENNILYVGITKNIKKRMFQHFFANKKKCKTTANNKAKMLLKILITNEKDTSNMAKKYENRYVKLCNKIVKNYKIYGGQNLWKS